MIALDLGVTQRRGGIVTTRAAAVWSAIWISIAVAFGGLIWWHSGMKLAVPYFTGYVVEKALSVDNLFVFLMVFAFFKVKHEHQHHLLYWGILGALIMRGALILAGTALVARFHWLLYGFGVFLTWTAWKMAFSKDDGGVDPEQNRVLKLARRYLPISSGESGKKFFVRQAGRLMATPLFLILIVVETTDLLFALDSIPAILGISQDPFIVYTSNACAILGLRSLFFLVASLMDKFHYLKVGLSVVLAFVGVKMIVETFFDLGEAYQTEMILGSLGFIGVTLTASVVFSVVWPPPGPNGHP
ncbi:MAG: TerC family protein [Myxococcales bacterium]|nr:TerC family protein [Myxococcales bacterium]